MGRVTLPRPSYAFMKCIGTTFPLNLTLPATQIKYTIKTDGFERYNFRHYAGICREGLRITQKDGKCTYNVAMRCVRETTVEVEMRYALHNLSMHL
jgi:hypothetical protein